MPTNITMKDGDVITLGFSQDNEALEREALDVIEKYCGSDFVRWYISETVATWEYDPEDYERQNEEYADAFREIANILFEYRTKVFEKKTKLYRKDVESMMKAIGGIVDDMV
jgi:hypothetical protein